MTGMSWPEILESMRLVPLLKGIAGLMVASLVLPVLTCLLWDAIGVKE